MSAEIIAFPLRTATGLDQQRWIPAPRARGTEAPSLRGWLRLAGVFVALVASWLLVIGATHLIAAIL